jgi:hypothetical protein
MGRNKERVLENVSKLGLTEICEFKLFCLKNDLHYYYDEVYDKAYGLFPDEEVHDSEVVSTLVGGMEIARFWDNNNIVKSDELVCI